MSFHEKLSNISNMTKRGDTTGIQRTIGSWAEKAPIVGKLSTWTVQMFKDKDEIEATKINKFLEDYIGLITQEDRESLETIKDKFSKIPPDKKTKTIDILMQNLEKHLRELPGLPRDMIGEIGKHHDPTSKAAFAASCRALHEIIQPSLQAEKEKLIHEIAEKNLDIILKIIGTEAPRNDLSLKIHCDILGNIMVIEDDAKSFPNNALFKDEAIIKKLTGFYTPSEIEFFPEFECDLYSYRYIHKMLEGTQQNLKIFQKGHNSRLYRYGKKAEDLLVGQITCKIDIPTQYVSEDFDETNPTVKFIGLDEIKFKALQETVKRLEEIFNK